jgi:AraC-like DNA-binding protein
MRIQSHQLREGIAGPTSHPAAFALSAQRIHNFDTGWRSLPSVLLETPRGGHWQVKWAEQTLRAGPNDVLVVTPGTHHQLQAHAKAAMTSTWILLNWEVGGLPLRMPQTCTLIHAPDLAQTVEALVAALISLTQPTSPTNPAALARFHALSMHCLATVAESITVGISTDPCIERVLMHIANHLDTPLRRSDLAALAGLSESRLHDRFRLVVGEAPMAYINRRRIEKATRLLTQTPLPVAAIGDACGFMSPQYFSRIFQQHTGLAPKLFRQQMR